jgi:type I restriction enzyme S subunit
MSKAKTTKPEWKMLTLQGVCVRITDGTHKTPRYVDSGVRFISIKNIRAFQPINFKSYEKYITTEEHRGLTRRAKPEFDDILFPRIGTLGFAKRIDFDEEVSIFVGLGLLKPDKSKIRPKYLEYWMNTPLIHRLSHERANGSGRLTLPLEETRKFPVLIPPLNDQDAIVAEIEKQFSRLDAGVASLKRVQAALKRYRAGVLKAACEGRLFSSDKQGWRHITFGEVCRVQGGYAFKSSDYQSEGIPLVRISNLVNGAVTIDRKTPRLPPPYITDFSEFLLRSGDIVIAMSGATTGKMATFKSKEPALLNQRVGRFLVKANTNANREYLALVVEQIARQVLRDAYGAAQPNISPKKIEAMNLSLPPFSEQGATVAEVERRLSVVENLGSSIAGALQLGVSLRRSILSRAFSLEGTS